MTIGTLAGKLLLRALVRKRNPGKPVIRRQLFRNLIGGSQDDIVQQFLRRKVDFTHLIAKSDQTGTKLIRLGLERPQVVVSGDIGVNSCADASVSIIRSYHGTR